MTDQVEDQENGKLEKEQEAVQLDLSAVTPPVEQQPRRRRALVILFTTLILILSPILTILALRWLPPPTSSFMIQKQVAKWRGKSKTGVAYRWVKWGEISPHLPSAVVASEDQKFPFHNGFDMEGIAEARKRNERGARLRGGSTISQQVAKNLFLWPGKSYLRKGLEAAITVWIEWLWPKRRLLHVYLNISEFGDGVYGVGAAADLLLKKPTTAITRYDAALLAAVLPQPKRLRVERPSAYVQGRVEEILGQMQMLGDGYLSSLNEKKSKKTKRPHR